MLRALLIISYAALASALALRQQGDSYRLRKLAGSDLLILHPDSSNSRPNEPVVAIANAYLTNKNQFFINSLPEFARVGAIHGDYADAGLISYECLLESIVEEQII